MRVPNPRQSHIIYGEINAICLGEKKESSPRSTNSYRNLSHASSRKKSIRSYSKANPYEIPAKKNLRIMNVNCRSIRDKTAEFKVANSYIKPDIICGTESWLHGIKPGKTSPDAIKSSEIFPEEYTIYRNDRGSRGAEFL
ncbi:hypothetical protein MAR_035852 [Mya arenaria]|uniref:Uncharacterized protein n=1 Tax=Mya arenaria TaxID=6604 RepID=A0ABY7EPY1_MYAAR|nr:hypothetical protein MAR_035852 [Mya arenaria]